MRCMSEKQFENFLAETLIKWGQDRIQEGYRYQFQSPDSDNSLKLYNALNSQCNSFVAIKDVDIPVLSAGSKKLLLVLHNEDNTNGFSENFISYIRDIVAAQQGEIKSCALLVIHNSLLDTLINSAENIAQPGWVWHPNEIMEDRNIYTGERYKNIFELRYTKMKFLSEDLPNKVKHYTFILFYV